VETVQPFQQAGFTDLALVQVADERPVGLPRAGSEAAAGKVCRPMAADRRTRLKR
jgi:hypothetical protein